MNRLIAFLLIGCFSLNAFYEWLFVWWMDLPELPESMWAAYDLSKILIIILLSWVLWLTFPLSKLCMKSLSFIVFLEAVCTLVQFFYNGQYQGSLEYLKVASFSLWLLWAYFRSYQLKPSTILPNRVYFVSGKPKNIWSFYLSLFGDPTGSKGIYVNGRLYGYHQDKFVSRALDYERMNVLAVEIKSGTKLEEYLRTMIGTEYSMTNNCLIMRLKVWWHVRQTTL